MRHLLLIASAILLSACGLKKDLYLPAPETATPPRGRAALDARGIARFI